MARHRARSVGTLIMFVIAVTLMSSPVSAHPHPTGSVDRVTPGAVWVEASAHIEITLFDDRSQLRQVSRAYDVPMGRGSGFTVTPDGVVVTATGIVQPPGRDPRIYAANRVFAEYFKQKVPADFARHHVKGDLDFRLQDCYPPQNQFSTCVTKMTAAVSVFPYADPPVKNGLPAEVLRAGTEPGAPAVVKVTKGAEAGTMRTVPLATSLGSTVEPADVMAFTGRPGPTVPPTIVTAHFSPAGSRTFKQEEQKKLITLLDQGGVGGGVIDDRKSEIVALISGGGDSPVAVVPAEQIRSALEAAGTPARRGQVDGVYETALAHYHNRSYANAIPVLEEVLRLRPDDAVTAEHLRTAKAKKGTAQDASRERPQQSAKGGFELVPVLLLGLGLLAALGAVGMLIVVRRRRRPGSGPSGPPAGSPPGVSPEAPPEDRAAATSLDRIVTAPALPPRSPQVSPDQQPEPHPREPAAARGSAAGGQAGSGSGLDRYCTKCGLRLPTSHAFCGFCGHPADS